MEKLMQRVAGNCPATLICGFSSPEYMEISSLEAIKQSVIHGLGVSIVSSLAIKQEIKINY
jgi:DNA-binding transcriptional LysR family regulator